MIRMIDERIRRKLAEIRLAFRGLVTLVNAAGSIQLVQGEGLNGEKVQGAEYFQHFGFRSNMPEGTMFVTIPLGGKTVHCVIVASEHADYGPKGLLSGESALYNAQGMKITLTKDGIVVDGGGKPIKLQNFSEVDFMDATGVAPYQFVHTGCACPVAGVHPQGSTIVKASK